MKPDKELNWIESFAPWIKHHLVSVLKLITDIRSFCIALTGIYILDNESSQYLQKMVLLCAKDVSVKKCWLEEISSFSLQFFFTILILCFRMICLWDLLENVVCANCSYYELDNRCPDFVSSSVIFSSSYSTLAHLVLSLRLHFHNSILQSCL